MRKLSISLALVGLASAPALAQASAQPDRQRAIEAAMAAATAAEQAARAAREAANVLAQTPPPASGESTEAAAADENAPVDEIRTERLQEETQRMRAAITEGVANGPNDRALKASGAPDLQLTASADDKVASLSWTLDVSGSPRPGRLSATQFTMTASASLDQGEAHIVGLRGFPGGTEIKLNFIHFSSAFSPSATERRQVTTARENCRRAKAGQPDLEAICNPYDHPRGVSRFVAEYNPAGLAQMLDEALPGNVYFFGGELGANQTDFEYLDQPTFTMQSQSRFGFTGTLFAGMILPSGRTSLMGSFTYGRRYRAQSPITLCQAINAIPQTQCITAPAGPPTRRNQAILSIDARHAFPVAVGEFAHIAIAPEFSFDFNNHSYSLDVPLYLASDGQGQLRGGVRFGYLNSRRAGGGRDDDFTLALFVGAPFSIFR